MAEITISNKMTSSYRLRGRREINLTFDFLVGNYKQAQMGFEVRAKAKKASKMPFSLEVVYGGSASLGFEITPRIMNRLPFELEVAPHNRMTAMYNLIEPPIKHWKETPVQDSYTLSTAPYSSINYGKNNSLVIGESARGNGTPFIQFDLSSLGTDIRVKSAKLRLYYSDYNSMSITLNKVQEAWRELNITYLNAPQEVSYITNQYTNNAQGRYIEFEVTDVVADWIQGIPNNGFSLISTDPSVMSFRSRETTQPPELLVDYFSTEPINSSRKRLPFSITPQQEAESLMPFQVEVLSFFRRAELGFSVFAHDPNHRYNSAIGFSVDASRDKFAFDMLVKRKANDSLGFAISVTEERIDTLGFEVEVPIFKKQKDLGFEVFVQQKGKEHLGFEVEIVKVYQKSKEAFAFEIFAEGKYKPMKHSFAFEVTADRVFQSGLSSIDFSVTPQFEKESPLGFEVESDTDIFRGYGRLPFEIGVQGRKESNLGFSVNVSRDKMQFTVGVFNTGETGIGFEVSAQKLLISQLPFAVGVGLDSSIGFEIEVEPSITKTTSFIYIV